MQESEEGIAGGGYWFRVDYSPAAMAVQRKIRRFSPMDNKENIRPPEWRRSPVARYRRTGRTPLPEWYPRTPLRDITSIVQAVQRRRLHLQVAQSAEAPPSAATPLHNTSPHPHEPSSSSIASHSSNPTPAMPVSCFTTTTITSPLQAEEMSSTAAPPTVPAINETESPLLNSIEQIEKAVRRNLVALKKENAVKRATQLRTLKSLR